MKMKTSFLSIAASAALAAMGVSVGAAPFLPGDLVVDRFGDGTQTLANTGNTQFLDDYTTAGVLTGTTAIPDTGASALIVSGTATSEGAISRSADGTLIALAGYNTNRPYTASLTASTSTAVPRGVGSVDALGTYTLQATTTAFSGNNIRGATASGTNFFGSGGNSGTVLLPGGSATPATAGTAVQTTVANTRVNNIFNGNLYFSTGSGTKGVYGFAGVPTATGATATLIVPDNNSPYDFAFNSAGTVAYLADDTATAAGGILRYDLVGGVFTLTRTLGTGVANIGARGLAVDFTNPLAPVVYATTAEGTANRLISIVDTGTPATTITTTLATAATNEAFRGLEFTPTAVPEPTALGLLGIAAVAGMRRRRA